MQRSDVQFELLLALWAAKCQFGKSDAVRVKPLDVLRKIQETSEDTYCQYCTLDIRQNLADVVTVLTTSLVTGNYLKVRRLLHFQKDGKIGFGSDRIASYDWEGNTWDKYLGCLRVSIQYPGELQVIIFTASKSQLLELLDRASRNQCFKQRPVRINNNELPLWLLIKPYFSIVEYVLARIEVNIWNTISRSFGDAAYPTGKSQQLSPPNQSSYKLTNTLLTGHCSIDNNSSSSSSDSSNKTSTIIRNLCANSMKSVVTSQDTTKLSCLIQTSRYRRNDEREYSMLKNSNNSGQQQHRTKVPSNKLIYLQRLYLLTHIVEYFDSYFPSRTNVSSSQQATTVDIIALNVLPVATIPIQQLYTPVHELLATIATQCLQWLSDIQAEELIKQEEIEKARMLQLESKNKVNAKCNKKKRRAKKLKVVANNTKPKDSLVSSDRTSLDVTEGADDNIVTNIEHTTTIDDSDDETIQSAATFQPSDVINSEYEAEDNKIDDDIESEGRQSMEFDSVTFPGQMINAVQTKYKEASFHQETALVQSSNIDKEEEEQLSHGSITLISANANILLESIVEVENEEDEVDPNNNCIENATKGSADDSMIVEKEEGLIIQEAQPLIPENSSTLSNLFNNNNANSIMAANNISELYINNNQITDYSGFEAPNSNSGSLVMVEDFSGETSSQHIFSDVGGDSQSTLSNGNNNNQYIFRDVYDNNSWHSNPSLNDYVDEETFTSISTPTDCTSNNYSAMPRQQDYVQLQGMLTEQSRSMKAISTMLLLSESDRAVLINQQALYCAMTQSAAAGMPGANSQNLLVYPAQNSLNSMTPKVARTSIRRRAIITY